MKYTTEIKHNGWKDGDILIFPLNMKDEHPHWDVLCEVINGKLMELPEKIEEATIKPDWKCIRVDYKFISDGTWYLEGTEAFPTHHIDEEDFIGVFLGWTNEAWPEYDGKLPRWDGECCNLGEFEIVKRNG